MLYLRLQAAIYLKIYIKRSIFYSTSLVKLRFTFYSTTNASSPVKPEDLFLPFQERFSRVPRIISCYNLPRRGLSGY